MPKLIFLVKTAKHILTLACYKTHLPTEKKSSPCRKRSSTGHWLNGYGMPQWHSISFTMPHFTLMFRKNLLLCLTFSGLWRKAWQGPQCFVYLLIGKINLAMVEFRLQGRFLRPRGRHLESDAMFSSSTGYIPSASRWYRVFIKYCVFSLKFCDFSELCQFWCSAGFLPAWCVYTHWHRGKTEKGQSPEYFWKFEKNHQYLMNTL